MVSWQPLQAGDPRECGGFHLTHRLGQGGFGTVFLGFRPDLPDPAAVKIFTSQYAGSPQWRKRFLREIEMIKTMAGLHTAALLDSGGHDEQPWLATRYVHAPPLHTLVHQYGAFDVLPAWWLATGLGEALAEIHAKGILHRDLKPQNILVEGSGIKVIDFGISRFSEGGGITVDPSFFGSSEYCANEHLLDPRKATEKSDVFALGAVLVWVTTGRTPFDGVMPHDRLAGFPPNLDLVPESLYDLVESCLAADPANRPTALTVFRTALDHLTDFAVPLASEAGLPLPPEIRDFVDAWAAEPVPVPTFVLVSTGGSGVGAAAYEPHRGTGGGDGASAAGRDFSTGWVARWRDVVDRRRDSYGQ
ncbi:serine/threonine-protein kinase [Micromonospora sp. 4G57]|uniref:Serine/threonine-protein kinase n=1 Tax=Micromonospora sicca TaxID=2202420 RepID=A0ABU5JKA9_9ACTN|nr:MULTISPECIES: serine/threonine-protein kinase [unclassified Micromonospora]MDZ5447073.1 serine/threonine-protein kinase [Micromonospora sp. 4G57]MDZ5493050.1 serine/threonine-protein kinase [Micromonospora sp. 4G53]